MKTFALDSSQRGVCLALLDESGLIAGHAESLDGTQSALLLKRIDSLFRSSPWSISEIERVAFCHGPGSFTSLRIALATLMGLFLFSPAGGSIPIVAGSSLLLRCLSVGDESRATAVLMRAGRQRVYLGLRQPGGEFSEAALSPEEAVKRLERMADIQILGDGLSLFSPKDREQFGLNSVLSDEDRPRPEAFLPFLSDPCAKRLPSLSHVRLNYLLDPDIG